MNCNWIATRALSAIAIGLCFSGFLPQANTAHAAPGLLYQWNFDGETGSTANNTGFSSGGSLTMLNSAGVATDLHSAAGTGHSGAINDRAFDASSGSYSNPSPIAASSLGDISTSSYSKITITGWLKDTADTNNNGSFSRILTIGPQNYDGAAGTGITQGPPNSGLYLGVYNAGFTFAALQLKVNGAGGQDGSNGIVSSSDVLPSVDPQSPTWTFFAVTYDSTAAINFSGGLYTNPNKPTVAMYVGDNTQPLGAAAFTAAYPGVTGNNPTSPGALQFSSEFAYLMNNAAQTRPYVGLGDDFRIYNGVLSPAQLESVREGLALPIEGDWNQDGAVTGADIPVMLKALADLSKFESDNSYSPDQVLDFGDANGDGFITNADIQPVLDLVAASGGGAVSAVPEPATWTLLVGGIVSVLFGKNRLRETFFKKNHSLTTKYLHRL